MRVRIKKKKVVDSLRTFTIFVQKLTKAQNGGQREMIHSKVRLLSPAPLSSLFSQVVVVIDVACVFFLPQY